MTEAVMQGGFSRRSSAPGKRRRVALRAWAPPLVAVACLLMAHFLFGAASPVSALFVSACLIGAAVLSILAAGPRFVTFGMAMGIAAIWIFAASGFSGPIDRAAPALAILFASGAIWATGYVCARQRGALDIVWTGLVWSSFVFCLWSFFQHIADALSGAPGSANLAFGFSSAPAAASLFGLFALIGSARILHVVKQMDAEALSRSAMIDRLFRDALGGMLLLGFSLTCLVMTGSRVGILLTGGVLLFQACWDTWAITQRDHRNPLVRWLARLSPLIAAGLCGFGIVQSFLHDESVSSQVAHTDILPRLQRLQVYFSAWLERPLFGHGLGSLHIARDRLATLSNAEVLAAPGDAQNVFLHWMVETGAVGTLAILTAIAAIHVGIFRAFGGGKMPRTFIRLALVASLLMTLHGVADNSLVLPSLVWLYAFLLGAACGVAVSRRGSSSREMKTV
ncbi:MAG: hypothetical protein GC155_02040 [Alphaproteobacteria bacterium]|nr:hypothetical protein [Alphaproteobacteria bacterium]